jgi:hypothetical protein
MPALKKQKNKPKICLYRVSENDFGKKKIECKLHLKKAK